MTHSITKLEKKAFESPDETRRPFEKGLIDVVQVGGLTFQRETLEPGWKWSEHVRPNVGGESCQKFHVKYILSGRQRVVMQDATEEVLEPGDVAVMPPGHDAWVEGDEPKCPPGAHRRGWGLILIQPARQIRKVQDLDGSAQIKLH